MRIGEHCLISIVISVILLIVKKNQSVKITPEKKLFSFIDSLNMKNPAIIDITKKHGKLFLSLVELILSFTEYNLYEKNEY